MNRIFNVVLFLVVCFQTFALSAIIQVPGSQPTIQAAILASLNGDTVLVAPGTYSENINYRGKNIVVASRYIFTHDPLDIYSTSIFGGSPVHDDTASCVLFISGEDSTAVLEGFTLSGGTGTNWMDEHGSSPYVEGGGILIQYSSPTIKNNRIINNEAIRVYPNSSSAGGGAIRCGDGNPHILNNYIGSNKGMYGGGIVLNYSGAVIKNNVIEQNSVFQAVALKPTYGGGGIWINGVSDREKFIENNTIVNNTVTGTGSGLAGRGGAVVMSSGGMVTFRNNIVWGNTQDIGVQVGFGPSTTVNVTYNNVQDGITGTGNISQNPMFSDVDNHLADGSPCIDAGDPEAIYNDPSDPVNGASAQSYSKGTTRNDMGAFGGPGRTAERVQIELHPGTGGSIIPESSPSLWYESIYIPVGSSETMLIVPDENYIVSNVLVNGNSQGAVSTYMFTNVRSVQSIEAVFQRAYSIVASSGGHGVVNPSGTIIVNDGLDTTFTFTPEHGYRLDSVIVDDAFVGTPSSYSFTNVSSAHTVRANFQFDSMYVKSYRSFRPDSIAFDVDNLGKQGKVVKRKEDKAFFTFSLTAPKTVLLTLKFATKTSGAVTINSNDTITSWTNVAQVVTPVAVDSGSVVTVTGIGYKGKKMKASYIWATLPKATKGNVPDSSFSQNMLGLPMPNRVNVLSELFGQNAFNGPLLAGFPMPTDAKKFGWFSTTKMDDVLKSLYEKKTGVHSGTARNFDVLSSLKPLVGKYSSLPPAKHNNVLFANLLALKISVAASALELTPIGLGELVYNDGTLNPLNGKMVKELAMLADSMLSARSYVSMFSSKNQYETKYGYSNLSTAIGNILSAFEGSIDTTTGGFSTSLSLTGEKQLLDVSFLYSNPTVVPARISRMKNSSTLLPDGFILNQNNPNPFNPTTTLSFVIGHSSLVTLKVYDMLGREVASLLNNENVESGLHEVQFDASNFASGVYFYRITTQSIDDNGIQNTFTDVKRMMLIK